MTTLVSGRIVLYLSKHLCYPNKTCSKMFISFPESLFRNLRLVHWSPKPPYYEMSSFRFRAYTVLPFRKPTFSLLRKIQQNAKKTCVFRGLGGFFNFFRYTHHARDKRERADSTTFNASGKQI